MRLAQLIADLEPKHNPDVDMIFVSRFDCDHSLKAIESVSAKFKVHTHINRGRRGVGWPAGCNDLWFGTMDRIYGLVEARQMPEYDAILTLEADSCPLGPYWHKSLMAEWHKAQQKRPTKMLGAMVQHPKPHVNGNALFSGDQAFLYEVSRKIGGCPPIFGWDFFLTEQFSRLGWGNTDLIKSYWQCATMPTDQIDGLIDSGVAFLHGVKDDSVLNHVRKRFVH